MRARIAPSVSERQKHWYISSGNVQKFSPSGSACPHGCNYATLSQKKHFYNSLPALGLKPDNSQYKLQINFCCLHAKYYIWLCKLKECPPKLPYFLRYLKHINEIENKINTTSQKKWEPLESFL